MSPRLALLRLTAAITLAACSGSTDAPTAPTPPPDAPVPPAPPAPPPTPRTVVYEWCSSSPIRLAAFREGTGDWQVLPIVGRTASFTITQATGTFVMVTGDAPRYYTFSYEGTADELQSLAWSCSPSTRLTLPLTVAPIASGTQAIVRSGGGERWLPHNMTLTGTPTSITTPAGTGDLLALLVGTSGAVDRLVLRRDVDYDATSALAIDFADGDALPPDTLRYTSSSDLTGWSLSYSLHARGRHLLMPSTTLKAGGVHALPWPTASQRRPTDRVQTWLVAPRHADGEFELRRDISWRSPFASTLAVPIAAVPAISAAPTVSAVSSNGIVRLDADFVVPAATRVVERSWWNNAGATVDVYTSMSFRSAVAGSWRTLPPFDAIPGWQPAFWPSASGTLSFAVRFYAWTGGGTAIWAPESDGVVQGTSGWSGPLR